MNLPTIIIDTREQTPLVFTRLPTTTAGLLTGDYSVAGLEDHFAVERKTIADLVASVTRERERFERELARLRGHEFRRLLIIGTRRDIESGNYVSKANPKTVLASVDTFEARYCLPVVWEGGGHLPCRRTDRTMGVLPHDRDAQAGRTDHDNRRGVAVNHHNLIIPPAPEMGKANLPVQVWRLVARREHVPLRNSFEYELGGPWTDDCLIKAKVARNDGPHLRLLKAPPPPTHLPSTRSENCS